MEVARDRDRRRLRRVGAAAVVVLSVGAAFGATRSALLDVDHVRVEGVEADRSAAVVDAASVPRGSPMTDLDTGAVEARVAGLAWVRDVDVERRWPGTVAIEVTEREAIAVDARGSGIDVTGRAVGPVAAGSDLPVVSGATVAEGEDLPSELGPVLEVLAEVPDSLEGEVAAGSLVGTDVELRLVDGIRVRFGPSDRHRAKFIAVEALLDQAGRSTIGVLDVRVPTSPSLTRRAEVGA